MNHKKAESLYRELGLCVKHTRRKHHNSLNYLSPNRFAQEWRFVLACSSPAAKK